MAAVAGSKGRLALEQDGPAGMQMRLVSRLLTGLSSPADAAGTLLAHGRVREVGIDTNMICNLSCQYCYLGDRAEAKGEVPLHELSGRLEHLIGAGAKLLAFIGKEPLADDRAVTLLAGLNALRDGRSAFRTGMVTNGTLVNRWIDRLVEADISYLDISIDGLSDWENRLRGRAVSRRIRDGVDAVLRSPLRTRFATATVLTDASLPSYPAFVSAMFDEGAVTCFGSPVLRFAMSKEVADIAVGLELTMDLCERLAASTVDAGEDHQVIIDLPYRYTWALLRSGRVKAEDVREDCYEALHWRIDGSRVFLKLNPFPYSYWRALRITHDGRVILNMDLAAHSRYAATALDLTDVGEPLPGLMRRAGPLFLEDFVSRHLQPTAGALHDRDLEGQQARAELLSVTA